MRLPNGIQTETSPIMLAVWRTADVRPQIDGASHELCDDAEVSFVKSTKLPKSKNLRVDLSPRHLSSLRE